MGATHTSEDVTRSPTEAQLPARAAWLLLGLSLLVILYSTLKHFDFRFRPLSLAQYGAGFVWIPSSLLDFPRNILLFMPFGFALAALLYRAGKSRREVWLLAGAAGLALTWLVESLQLFLPDRAPSVSDLVSNTLGAVAGAAAYGLWLRRTAVARSVRRALAVPRVAAALFGLYTLVVVFVAFLLGTATQFNDWQPDYPLLLGNERGGQRPWRGTVQEVAIFDRALSAAEVAARLQDGATAGAAQGVLAHYPLAAADDLQDHTGQQPALAWRSAAGADESSRQLDGQHWLQSETAVTSLNQALQAASQVTLFFTIMPATLDQEGPARILSVSASPLWRNLTVGQVGDSLILRLNTAVSGENGEALEIRFPAQLAAGVSQRLALVFDGASARLYGGAGQAAAELELLPGPVFYRYLNPYLPRYWSVTADPRQMWRFRLLYYALVFAPAGLLLALTRAEPWPRWAHAALWLGTVAGLPLLAEWALVAESGVGARPLAVFLGAAGVLLGALLVGPLLMRWRDARTVR